MDRSLLKRQKKETLDIKDENEGEEFDVEDGEDEPVKRKRFNQSRNAVLTCECDKEGGTGTRNWQDFPELKKVVPDKYAYKVCTWTSNHPGNFSAVLRLPITDFQELQDWLDSFVAKTKTTFRKMRTYRDDTIVNVYKVDLCCQHASRGKSAKLKPSKKSTNCPTTMSLLLKRVTKGSRSSDPHLKTLPTIIKLNWEHNHPTDTDSALRFRDVSEDTDKQLRSLLLMGHTVTSALNTYKASLQQYYGDKYICVAGDRSYVPDYGYVHRLKKALETDTSQQIKNDVNQAVKANISQTVKPEVNQSVKADIHSQPVKTAINQSVNDYAHQPVKAGVNQTVTANSVSQTFAPDFSQRLPAAVSHFDNVKLVEDTDSDMCDTTRVDEEEDWFHQYEKVLNNLDEFYERMRNSLSENLVSDPQTFAPAIKAFIENGNRVLNADGPSLCSALKSFGK